MGMCNVHMQRPCSTDMLSHLPHYHVVNGPVLTQGWRHPYTLEIASKQFTTGALCLEEGTY